MKICIIAPSLQLGGIERSLSNLANFFVNYHEVYFITLLKLPHFYELNSNINIIEPRIDFSRKMSRFKSIMYYIKVFSPWNGYLLKSVSKINPDTILSFGDIFPQISMLSLFSLNYPFYISNRSSPNINYNLKFTIIRYICYKIKKPTGVIAQTKLAMERKRIILGKDQSIKIIPNIVKSIPKSMYQKEEVIILVGRLHKDKGFDRAIKAISLLKNKTWKMQIIGEGPEHNNLLNLTNELKLEDRIEFVGKKRNVIYYMQRSSIFVLPSRKEGFPNALCEAMSAGLASIAFDIIAGPSDIIIDSVNGYLIKDDDINALAKKIDYLICHPEIRDSIGNEASKISNVYSEDEIGHAFLNYILCQ